MISNASSAPLDAGAWAACGDGVWAVDEVDDS